MNCLAGRILLPLLAMAVSLEFADGLRLEEASRQVSATEVIPYAVVYSANFDLIHALVASMRSVVRHTKANLNLYLFVENGEKQQFESLTQVDGVQINKKYFSRSDVDAYINKAFVPPNEGKGSPNLDIPHNYVRYIMAEQIPEADGMVWVDADTVATADIMTNMAEFLQSKKTVGAFPRQEKIFGTNSKKKLNEIASTTNLAIQKKPYFNAGFMYFSAGRYRESGVSKHLQQLIAENNKHKWWVTTGSQPPLNLLFGGEQLFQIKGIEYFDGMGYKKSMSTSRPGFYHWNGPHKPWKQNGYYKDLWERYANNTDMTFAKTGVDLWENGGKMDCSVVCSGEIDILRDWGSCECA